MKKKSNNSSRIKRVIKIFLLVVVILVVAEVIALLVLRSQIDRYAQYWNEQAKKPIPDNALVYVALGDSAAQGIGATSPRRGYVGLIASSLEDKTKRPVHVINLSKTGARLEDCIEEQLPQLAELSPDVVTIEIGANNMKDFEPDTFEKKFSEILSKLPQQTVVSNMPYFGGGRFSNRQDNVNQANKIIERLTKQSGHRLADLHKEVKTNDHLNTYAADFFHPSNAGYKNWHNAFWEVLREDDSVILP